MAQVKSKRIHPLKKELFIEHMIIQSTVLISDKLCLQKEHGFFIHGDNKTDQMH